MLPKAAAQEGHADGRGNRAHAMEAEPEPDTSLSTVISTGNQISYNGGPVLLGTTHIYYIWYGNWDSSSIDILTNLANNIGGSPYFNINTGYFDGQGRSVSNSVSLAATTQDNYSRGMRLGDNDIWLIVTSALTQKRLPIDSNGVYFVLTAADVSVTGFPNTLCGWHTEQSFGGTNIHYAFVGNPGTAGLRTCAAQIIGPNGNAEADAMASSLVHELEESVTDPNLDAWYDSEGNEVADKCAWTFGTTYTAYTGAKANMQLGAKDYLIQQDWVNALGGYCGLSYTPAPDFALTLTASPQTVVVASGVTGSYTFAIFPVRGFSAPVSFSVSGLPLGATASTMLPSTTGASFTVSTPGNLPGGSYPFSIVGSSGSLTRLASATLVVSGATRTLSSVSIRTISPEPSQVGQAYTVTYSVNGFGGAPTGSVTVSDGSVSCTATVAAGSCVLTSTTAGTKAVSVTYSGDNQFAPSSKTILHTVTYGGSLTHLASGSGWETTVSLVNLGPTAAPMSLNFYGDLGGGLNLPFTFPQGTAAPLSGSTVSQTLALNALLLVDTNGSVQTYNAGWGDLVTAGNVNGLELLRYTPSGQEAMVPVQTGNAGSYVVAFDNTSLVNALGTGVAIANLSPQAASVSCIVLDDTGAQIATGSTSLAALGHSAFPLTVQYPGTTGKRGTIEFFTPSGGQISMMALRANGNAFTPLPAIASGSEGGGGMAHIVSGGGWRSIFTVVNTGTTAANITLSFFDDGGNPLSLPLTFLQNGNLVTASKVSQAVAAGASLVIQAQGLDGQTAMGSAQFATDGSASAFALLRYDPSGEEATVPLQSGNASAYVVPYDNSGVLKIGMALANLSSQAASINVILRDDTGLVLQTATLPLTANGHTAFILDGNYPVTAGKRGTVEFDPVAGAQISVLGLRANGNFFTAVPALTK